MVDNSKSMQPLQTNLANNFGSFISQFVTKSFDFKIAVAATDAFRAGANFSKNPAYAQFKDGVGTTHSGVFVIEPSTPDLLNVFVTNAMVGISGAGDERAFSSFQEALTNPVNDGFLRADAFLAIVILSDEDDFSNPTRKVGTDNTHDYSLPGLVPVEDYVTFLDQLKNSSPTNRKYSVSAITVLDKACKAQEGTMIGKRYIELAGLADGVLGSVCDTSFADSLSAIQNRILELSTQFHLDKKPIADTIEVFVNDAKVTKNEANGWSYDSVANSVVFHGSAIPESGSSIYVNFDPEKLTF
jgi:hypothetical protein